MSHRRSGTWACFLLLAIGCAQPPSDADAALNDGGSVADGGDAGHFCANAAACDDHLFCNGPEVCMPGAVGADVMGCMHGAAPCNAGQTCDEAADRCSAMCSAPDADGDGVRAIACGGTDCDDTDPHRFPGNPEICDPAGHDEDCDLSTYGPRDADGDGYPDARCCNVGGACGIDCDDTRGGVHPDATEACNGLDDDCDTSVDEGVLLLFYVDADGDGYGSSSATPVMACGPSVGLVASNTDCDDAHAAINPGNPELCNAQDDDCSSGGGADPSEDADGDMHSAPTAACTGGFAKDDCDDTVASIHPGAAELCNLIDDDCSTGGGADPREDDDADGHADLGVVCSGGPLPHDDCNDTDANVHPGQPELCDRIDSDCSAGGGVEVAEDVDDDLHSPPSAACSGGPRPKDDCNDNDASVYPGNPLVAPALIAPRSGALTGSNHGAARGTLRPTFRWAAVPGCSVTYDIVVDDSCSAFSGFQSCSFSSPELSLTGISATTASPSADLPISSVAPVGARYFWRVRACVGATCSAWSRVRYLDVGRAPSDFDGDGYSDLAAGAYSQNATASSEGSVFVFAGGASGVGTTPSRTLTDPGHQASALFGSALAACDVDGDGFSDLVVGAMQQSNPESQEGNAFVFIGSAAGLSTTPATTIDNPLDQTSSNFGGTVACAGDVNGDAYADIIVGAPDANTSAVNSGEAFLFGGGPFGIAATPTATFLPVPPEVNGIFANSLASAGDVNGDGFDDIVIGGQAQDGSATNEGAAYVYYGAVTGPPMMPSVTLRDALHQANGRFGIGVAGVGDVDGDGYSDLAVGTQASSTGFDQGRVYVFGGGRTGVSATAEWTLSNPTPEDTCGFGDHLSPAGDVNGDGFADLLVSAPYAAGTTSLEGLAYVFLGSASGPVTPTTLTDPGHVASANFGLAVISVGDLNGDGLGDAAVGAPYQSVGSVFVYHGTTSSFPTTPTRRLDDPGAQVGSSFGWWIAGGP